MPKEQGLIRERERPNPNTRAKNTSPPPLLSFLLLSLAQYMSECVCVYK